MNHRIARCVQIMQMASIVSLGTWLADTAVPNTVLPADDLACVDCLTPNLGGMATRGADLVAGHRVAGNFTMDIDGGWLPDHNPPF